MRLRDKHNRPGRGRRLPAGARPGDKRCRRSVRRSGVVLIIVLVVVVMLALAGYTFAHMMIVHHQSVDLSGRQIQARALVDSGVENMRVYFMQDNASRAESGGHYNNPRFFQSMPVLAGDTPKHRGNFTVLAPNVDTEGNLAGVRYGLEDLSTRLNLNALAQFIDGGQITDDAARTLLMALPGMNEQTADSILDWLDGDDNPRENGAELDYYAGLAQPYAPKNGPLETVEELLLVRGVTPQMLFGLDHNRNGMVDQHELSGADGSGGSTQGASVDLQSGGMQRGWSGFITLYSQERNANAQGLPRINVNQENLEDLYNELKQVFNDEWAVFIVAYRQVGEFQSNGMNDAAGESGAGHQLDFAQPANTTLTQVLDLVGKKVSVRFKDEPQATILKASFPDDPVAYGTYLALLMDNLTTSAAPAIPGRININQCTRAVLAGIPGMEEELVDEIIKQRPLPTDKDADEDSNLKFETWLLTKGLVPLDKMRSLQPFITARGDVFQAQVVGYFEDGGAASRSEVVFDATSGATRIVFWRDISHLGRGYPLELLGAQLGSTY